MLYIYNGKQIFNSINHKTDQMKGAIIGDIIGSAFINDSRSTTEFQLFKPISSFTSDTVLTLATADSVYNDRKFEDTLKKWVKKYPYAGYDENFKSWAISDSAESYFGNGDGWARRVSPIGYACSTLEEVLENTEIATRVTHSLPAKIIASKASNAAIFLAKNGVNKSDIKKYITNTFNYNLEKELSELHEEVTDPDMESPVSAAITVFLLSNNYEDAIRKAISIGGPSNTIGSITGAIAYAYYKHIPKSIIKRALNRLTPEMVRFIEEFESKHLHTKDESEILISIH